jgi:monoterpene epsilon-lactone hydrolase
MASQQSYELVDLFKRLSGAVAANPNISIPEMRAVMGHLGDATAEPRRVDYIEVDAAGVLAMWAVPKNCVEDRILLCAHGGGYIAGSMYSHRKMYAHYAKKVGCRALIVNYGLAPENLHPGPVNDMVRAYRWLLTQGITPNHIAIAGDSAGGSLAITTMVRLRELGVPLPVASMPLSPWVDMEHTASTFESNKNNDALVTREMSEYMASNFLGEKGSRRDPLANPLFADLLGLPPVYIQAGGFEVLLDDSRALAEALKKANVDVKLEVFPEMQHIFGLLAGTAPEADEAIDKCTKWVRPKLGL